MSKTNIIIGVIIVLVLIVGGIVVANNVKTGQTVETNTGIDSATKDQKTSRKFRTLPELSFRDYNGNVVRLADFKGTPLVVNSWAVWCPFCLKELPDFAEIQKEFGEQVIIIAIDRAESLKTAKSYTDDLGITDDIVFLLDSGDIFYRSIGGFSMPETIFVDSGGNIREHKRGFMRIEDIRERVNNLLSLEPDT